MPRSMDESEKAPVTGVLRGFSDEHLQTPERVPVMLEFQSMPLALYRCQCERPTDANLAAYEKKLLHEHEEFMHLLTKMGVAAEWVETDSLVVTPQGVQKKAIRHEFTYLFNGVGLLLPGQMIAHVGAFAPVRAVHANFERPYLLHGTPTAAPAPTGEHNASVPFLRVSELWNRPPAQGGPITGDGVVVAVIDTGVDYTHPAFGGQPTAPNEKVLYAVSLTGEPPLDNFGHGTHVAGIIAGDLYKGTPRGDSQMQGVAPKAKLLAYKVLTGRGSGTSSNIILAMEDAVKRGAHVLNMSLGDNQADPHSPEAIAASNAMKAGSVVCVAAGNAGPARGTVGSPGTAPEVVTVGASTDDSVTAQFAHLQAPGAAAEPIPLRSMHGSSVLVGLDHPLHYVKCGLGHSPSDFPAVVKGNIALIKRGQIPFSDKGKAAQAAGAAAVIIYNNQPGPFFGSVDGVNTPVVSISAEDGQRLLDLGFDASGLSKATLQLDDKLVPQGDHLAEFSSRGPAGSAGLKPEVCAPGVSVLSTTILPPMALDPNNSMANPSGYTKASGTSMATPHIAGVAALMRQAQPKWDTAMIKAALVNTAKLMDGQGGVLDQGAGRVQPVVAAATPAVLVTQGDNQPVHSFGNYKAGAKLTPQQFVLRDLAGTGPQTYAIRAYYTQGHDGLSLEVSASTLTVPAHGEAQVLLTLVVHDNLPDGDYGGYLEASNQAQVLRVPFYLEVGAGSPDNAQPTLMHPGKLPRI